MKPWVIYIFLKNIRLVGRLAIFQSDSQSLTKTTGVYHKKKIKYSVSMLT